MTIDTSPRSPASRLTLLVWMLVLVAVAVGAVVALAELDDAAGLVLACVALLATALSAVLVVRDELRDEDSGPPPARRLLRPAVVTTLLAVAALGVAGLSAADEHAGTATSPDGPREAVQTTKDFLAAALVRGDGEAACGYLTPSEQRRVAAAAGDGRPCREAVDEAPAEAFVDSPRQLDALPARATRTRGGMRVTVETTEGRRTFELRPETPAERLAFDSPPGVWRITSGATTVLVR